MVGGKRLLTQIDLHEVTLTATPVGRGTRVLAVKSIDIPDLGLHVDPVPRLGPGSERDLQRWEKSLAEDMRNAQPIRVKTFQH
jgi:hypothetical protein